MVEARRKLAWEFEIPRAPRGTLHVASQTLVMHVNRQGASHRRMLNPNVLVPADQVDSVKAELAAESRGRGRGRGDSAARPLDPDLIVPADEAERAEAIASLEKFCSVFPDAFVVSERTSTWLASGQTGRLLSAGFHSMHGLLPRRRAALRADPRRRRTAANSTACGSSSTSSRSPPTRQYTDFIFFERTEPRVHGRRRVRLRPLRGQGRRRPRRRSNELAEVYLAKARKQRCEQPTHCKAIEDQFFDDLRPAIRRVEQARLAAEPSHLAVARQEFAERAYRRPLSDAERDELLSFLPHAAGHRTA